jgi:general stress protein 26
MFDAAGSKKVSFEYTVPYNLPVNKQYMSFAADGAQWVKIYFKVECTKYLKVPNH